MVLKPNSVQVARKELLRLLFMHLLQRNWAEAEYICRTFPLTARTAPWLLRAMIELTTLTNKSWSRFPDSMILHLGMDTDHIAYRAAVLALRGDDVRARDYVLSMVGMMTKSVSVRYSLSADALRLLLLLDTMQFWRLQAEHASEYQWEKSGQAAQLCRHLQRWSKELFGRRNVCEPTLVTRCCQVYAAMVNPAALWKLMGDVSHSTLCKAICLTFLCRPCEEDGVSFIWELESLDWEDWQFEASQTALSTHDYLRSHHSHAPLILLALEACCLSLTLLNEELFNLLSDAVRRRLIDVELCFCLVATLLETHPRHLNGWKLLWLALSVLEGTELGVKIEKVETCVTFPMFKEYVEEGNVPDRVAVASWLAMESATSFKDWISQHKMNWIQLFLLPNSPHLLSPPLVVHRFQGLFGPASRRMSYSDSNNRKQYLRLRFTNQQELVDLTELVADYIPPLEEDVLEVP